jgi:hypothetical protein
MARYNDRGHYTPDNVSIVLSEKNSSDSAAKLNMTLHPDKKSLGGQKGAATMLALKGPDGKSVHAQKGAAITNALRTPCPHPGCTVVSNPGGLARHVKVCPHSRAFRAA